MTGKMDAFAILPLEKLTLNNLLGQFVRSLYYV
jgi:hypothetical protein